MAKTKQNKMRRVSLGFADSLDLIKTERIKKGVDNKMISDTRLTNGIIADPAFAGIFERLSKKKRKEDLL